MYFKSRHFYSFSLTQTGWNETWPYVCTIPSVWEASSCLDPEDYCENENNRWNGKK